MTDKTYPNTIHSLENLSLLNEIGHLALAVTDLKELFRPAAELLRTKMHLQYVMIGTFDYDSGQILMRATAGIGPELAAAALPQGIDEGIIGEVAASGKTVVINDVSHDPRFLRAIPMTQSEVCVPLKVMDGVAGFINVESDRIAAFDQADVDLLEAVGSFLGQALRNAQLREELEQSKNYLESLVQHAGDAIVTFDREGKIRTWNNAAEQILGQHRDSVIYRNVLDLIESTPENVQQLYERILSGEVVRGIQVRHTSDDGSLHTLDLTMSAVRDSEGAVAGVSCILRDITEKIHAEAQLHRKIELDQVMNEISKEMTALLELDELLSRIAALMRRVIEYEILGIFLYQSKRQLLELKVAIGYDQDTVAKCQILRLGDGLLGHAAAQRKTILSTDLPNDPRAIQARTVDGRVPRSEIAVPIVSRDRILGGLVVESCDPFFFDAEKVQILETLAGQMAVCIENAQLFEDVLDKEHKLTADFTLARDLQASMLPESMPNLPGFEIAASYRPAESLGGDYYDYLWLDEGLLGLTMGDVSGKGVAAAMTMAAARSALRFAARMSRSPSQVLYHVNRRLFRDVKMRMYLTLFYCVLDPSSRVLRWSNAGHFPPLLLRKDGSIEELFEGGTVLALFDKSRYTSVRTHLESGDLLCFYTDGVIDALNVADKDFGKDRLLDLLRRKRSLSAKEIVRSIGSELKKFMRGAQQFDDITTLIMKVL